MTAFFLLFGEKIDPRVNINSHKLTVSPIKLEHWTIKQGKKKKGGGHLESMMLRKSLSHMYIHINLYEALGKHLKHKD